MAAYDPRKGGARISHGGTFNANPLDDGGRPRHAAGAHARRRTRGSTRSATGCAAASRACSRRRVARARSPASARCSACTGRPAQLTDYRSSRPKDPDAPLRVFLGLLNEGIILSQRGLGACSLAMGDEDIDRFVNALARVLSRE